MSKFRIVDLDRQSVKALLAGSFHLVQNTPAWLDFLIDFSGERDRSLTVIADRRPVAHLPALQHRNLIQSLPYPASYSGILLDEQLNPAECDEILELAFAHYSNYADVFSLCTSPFLPDRIGLTGRFDFFLDNEIQFIDLKPGLLHGTTSKFRNNLRRNLRKAQQGGVTIRTDISERILQLWYNCYSRRMADLGADRLPQSYFEKLCARLAPIGNIRLFSAWRAEAYLGGILVIYNACCADYYLSAFDSEKNHTQSSSAAFYQMLRWAKGSGIGIVNLQSTPTGSDQIYRFKKSWGAESGVHRYLAKILRNRERVLSVSRQQAAAEYKYHFYLPFSLLDPSREVSSGSVSQSRPERLPVPADIHK